MFLPTGAATIVPGSPSWLITDAVSGTTRRDQSLQGDGRAANDSSFGLWRSSFNRVTNGGFETNTTGWAATSTNNFARYTTRAKFGSASLGGDGTESWRVGRYD